MRIALITGASSGLGWYTARELAQGNECDELWVIARRGERLERLQKELSPKRVVPLALDLRDPGSYTFLSEKLKGESPQVIWFVNNAGFGLYGPFLGLSLSKQLDMISLNIQALTALTYLVTPYMPRGSHLVLISSSAAFLPIPYFAVYAATKSYVLSLGLSLAVELKPQGIFVTTVAPGPIPTEFQEVAGVKASTFERLLEIPPAQAVRIFLRDARKGKLLSIPGTRMRWGVRVLNLLPKIPLLPLTAHINSRRLKGETLSNKMSEEGLINP